MFMSIIIMLWTIIISNQWVLVQMYINEPINEVWIIEPLSVNVYPNTIDTIDTYDDLYDVLLRNQRELIEMDSKYS